MARIESKQIVAPKVFDPLRQELESTITKTKMLSDELQRQLDLQVKISKSVKNSATGYKQLAEAETKSKNALTEKEKIDRKNLTLQKQLTQVTKLEREQIAALTVEKQRRNKVDKQSAILTNQNIGAFERLNVKIKQLSDRYRNLIAVEGKETVTSKRLRMEILKLNATRDMANKSLGIHNANVGNYTSTVAKLRTGLAQLGLSMGVFYILRSAFGIVKDFDQATADLASVLGVTTDQMAALTEQSKELGATTIFTASEVAELQKEYAKLGFTQSEILGVTEATLQLAAATGEDLGQAATVVGSNLRAFGLDVSETQRVVDVMAKAFSSSSLDMEKFTVAMRQVAPVAKNAGYSIEETTALLGTLTDRGVDASSAGTGLRNVFLELAKQGLTFDEAMSKINNSTNKNKTSMELFGKKGATVGAILAASGVSADLLTEKLNNAGGAAAKMADTQLDTLGGAVKLLISAWEGWILKMNEAGGAGDTLKTIIKFLAKNLDFLLNTLILVGKAWLAYSVGVKASAAATLFFGKSLGKAGKMLSGPVFVAITLVAAAVKGLVQLFKDAVDSSDALTRAYDKVNEKMDEEVIKLKLVGKELFATTAASEERQEVLNKINAEYGTTLQNLQDEAEFANQVAAAYDKIVASLRKEIALTVIKDDLIAFNKELRRLEREQKETGGVFGTLGGVNQVAIKALKDEIKLLENEFTRLNQSTEKVIDGRSGINELGDRFEENDKKVKKLTKSVKDLKNEVTGWSIEDQVDGFDFDYRLDRVDFSKKSTEDISYDATEATNAALREIERLELKEKELWKSIRSEVANTNKMITEMYNNRLALIDREIAKKEMEYNDSKTREEQLRADAKERGLDATEAINLERENQKKALQAQQDLERKKQRIVALIAALNALTAKIEAGDGNPVKNVKADILNLKSFIEGSFYEGTPYTIADALGGNGVKDGHIVRIDDNEAVLNPEQTRALNIRKGGNSTDDIVNIYKNGMAKNNSSLRNKLDVKKRTNDHLIVKELQELKKITQTQSNPGKMAFNSVVGAFQYQKGAQKLIYPIRKR
jgi:hypothetical protein